MYPRLLIAGTASGVGKTTLTMGLMGALKKRGYNVQPYKVGPDYIDPGFHKLVTGNSSRNLDSYLLGEEGVQECFLHAAKGADISLIEGVMGLFDGKKGRNDQGSTAHIAKILKAPVILIMDVAKMARSAVAMAYGYMNFDPKLHVAGVILNNVGSKGHYQMIQERIEEELGLKVLGYLPRQKNLELTERHLGLVPITESKELAVFVNRLTDLIEDYIDLDSLVALAEGTPKLEFKEERIFIQSQEYDLTLGIAYDEAFNFYYQDNLDILENLGVKLKYFSPLKDHKLPEVNGLYIGGGFPESFLEQLAENNRIKEDIYRKVKAGLPTYAECGGLMYLAEEIRGFNSNCYSMVGVVPAKIEMMDSLQAMGYVKAKAVNDNLLLKEDETVKGHEFHYSKLIDLKEFNSAYQLYGGKGTKWRYEGFANKNLLASYVHLHFGSNLEIVKRFLEIIKTISKEMRI
ncbi:cobyrinate a,c-diamide synthase [Orenia marismortui]|uniref:Cobyrinate a,c-diamide synthase n=1 Tax=Orenia marismortui TaxID=46469 RepID=A0A4R8H2Z4_9FIRM|nr:cobyrinate a,c-diamide synthase [Orenia marismortui]TDX52990.1 cobyrinic acid a,c-diamide synthase [Orenia marismortui]